MTTLTTADTQSNRDEIVAAFISVLDCSSEEASFFLESALWNIEKAVHFWLDAAGNGKRRATDSTYPTYASRGVGPWSSSNAGFHSAPPPLIGSPLYTQKKITIVDLPPEWEARVNPADGRIRFWHVASGHSQSRIPREFANIIGASIEGRTSVDGFPTTLQTGPASAFYDFDQQMNQEGLSGKDFAVGSTAGGADDASIRADVGDEPQSMNQDEFPASPRFESQLPSGFASASAASLEVMGSELSGTLLDDI